MTTDTLTRALAAIDAATGRADAATPGPWESLRWRARADGWFVPALVPDGCPVNDEWTAATAAFIAHARTDVPLLSAATKALAGIVAHQTDDSGAPWWAWGHCLGCGAEAGPPNNTGYAHAPDCPALAADAALAALASAAGDGSGRGGQQ